MDSPYTQEARRWANAAPEPGPVSSPQHILTYSIAHSLVSIAHALEEIAYILNNSSKPA